MFSFHLPGSPRAASILDIRGGANQPPDPQNQGNPASRSHYQVRAASFTHQWEAQKRSADRVILNAVKVTLADIVCSSLRAKHVVIQ